MAEEVRNKAPDVKNDPPEEDRKDKAPAERDNPPQAPPEQRQKENQEQQNPQEKQELPLGHRRHERVSLEVKQANAAEQMKEVAPQVWAAIPQRGGGVSYVIANEQGGFSSVFYDPRRGRVVTRALDRRFSFESLVRSNPNVQLSPNVRYNQAKRGFEFIGGQGAQEEQQAQGAQEPAAQQAQGAQGAREPGEVPPPQGGGGQRPPQGGGGAPPEMAQDTIPPHEGGHQAPPPRPPQGGGAPPAAPGGNNSPLLVKIVSGTRILVQDDGKALVFE